MKISEITQSDVAEYIRIEEGEYSEKAMQAIMTAAKAYILEYTGLSEEEADTKEDFWIAYMALCQDMHDNRSMYVEKNNTNKVVESVLSMHRINLL